MGGQDDVSPLANHQISFVGQESSTAQLVNFFEELLRIDHHAIPEDAALATTTEHAGRASCAAAGAASDAL